VRVLQAGGSIGNYGGHSKAQRRVDLSAHHDLKQLRFRLGRAPVHLGIASCQITKAATNHGAE
jgi:hypothetical protein